MARKHTKPLMTFREALSATLAESGDIIYWMTITLKEIEDPTVPISKEQRAKAVALKELIEGECPSLRVMAGVDIDMDIDVDVWAVYVVSQGERRPIIPEESKILDKLGIVHGRGGAVVEFDWIAGILGKA